MVAHPPSGPPGIDRRRVLQAFGALCAAAAVPRTLWEGAPAGAAPTSPVTLAELGDGTACFDAVTIDTFSAVAAFVVPGDDPYSLHQGQSAAGPGGVAAGAPQILALALNQVLTDPTMIDLLWDRFGPELEQLDLPDDLAPCLPIGSAIEQEGTVPLAPVVALLINLLAVSVDPAAASGPFVTPFARLTWQQKAETWRRFEQLPDGLRPPAWQLDVPVVSEAVSLLDSLAGIIDYASGAVLELTGFFTYSEILAWDRDTRPLKERPVGWELSDYLPGLLWPPDGWDEFLGYYQGRTSVDA